MKAQSCGAFSVVKTQLIVKRLRQELRLDAKMSLTCYVLALLIDSLAVFLLPLIILSSLRIREGSLRFGVVSSL